MIPLRDDVPNRSVPYVNFALIALCSLVFVLQLGDNRDGRAELVERYGMVPSRTLAGEAPLIEELVPVRTPTGILVTPRERLLESPAFSPWWTLLSCIFLHGGWMHFLGNMWFLWIFGDNVEDRFGHVAYLAFYLAAGVAASLLHLFTNSGSNVPTIGASGAIAGVMGAYFLLYPRARVLTLVPILFFIQLMVLPAAVFLGIWFVLQLLQGTIALGATRAGGVAWWAHIGGFVFGAAVVWMLARSRRLRREPPHVEFRSRRLGVRRPPDSDRYLH